MNQADVTVIVPTFNEADNVQPLTAQLREVLGTSGRHCEILFVDDSSDHTPSEVLVASRADGVPVRLLHRSPGSRAGGLGGAVAAGMKDTAAATVVVMDGDLQHPPATVTDLLDALETSGADVAVASRYVDDGSAAGLDGGLRRAVSGTSTALARLLFPRRLRHCSDPMTGFFALRTAAIEVETLQPMGFKILLEILARHRLRVTEVPFVFGDRQSGESKAGLAQGMKFLWQLLNLKLGRAGRFAAVGGLGVLVNLAVMALLLTADVGYLAASLLAAEVSILTNFALQERLVFQDVAERRGRWRRCLQTCAVNNVEALVRLPLLAGLVEVMGLPELLGQAILLAGGFAFRFLAITRLVYGRSATATPTIAEVHVHGSIAPPAALVPQQRRPGAVPGSAAGPADLDIVIPALNEEVRIGPTLTAIADVLDSAPFRARVILVDNGSTDRTVEVAGRHRGRLDLTTVGCPVRGKGAAVRRGVLVSTAPTVAYCDADLSTPPTALSEAMALSAAGSRAVIGSRRVPGAGIRRRPSSVRRLGSRVFQRMASRLVGNIADTQCGFKMLEGDLAREVFREMKIDGYAFDVELLARLRRRQVALDQLPVQWSHDEGTRLRVAIDGYQAFRDLREVRRAVAPSPLTRSGT